MLELTAQQIALLERLRERGFALVAFPLYANYIGVRRGECAALLAPVPGNGLRVFGDAFVMVAGNPAVRMQRNGHEVYVWKGTEVPATPERNAALAAFASELAELLLATA